MHMAKPDMITVSVEHTEEVTANRVDLHVSIRGATLFTGTAALKKAKEVEKMVSALQEVGVRGEDISLRSARAESEGGLLGRSSSATYQLRIRCSELEKMAEILGVVTTQKNVHLDELVWRYPDEAESRVRWLGQAITEAKGKAQAIAQGLGVKLLAVYRFTEEWSDDATPPVRHYPGDGDRGMYKMRAAASAVKAELGFPLSDTKRIELRIIVKFRVGEMATT